MDYAKIQQKEGHFLACSTRLQAEMAIEIRGAQQYYYRKRRRGRRVISIYVGKVKDHEVKAVMARDKCNRELRSIINAMSCLPGIRLSLSAPKSLATIQAWTELSIQMNQWLMESSDVSCTLGESGRESECHQRL